MYISLYNLFVALVSQMSNGNEQVEDIFPEMHPALIGQKHFPKFCMHLSPQHISRKSQAIFSCNTLQHLQITKNNSLEVLQGVLIDNFDKCVSTNVSQLHTKLQSTIDTSKVRVTPPSTQIKMATLIFSRNNVDACVSTNVYL